MLSQPKIDKASSSDRGIKIYSQRHPGCFAEAWVSFDGDIHTRFSYGPFPGDVSAPTEAFMKAAKKQEPYVFIGLVILAFLPAIVRSIIGVLLIGFAIYELGDWLWECAKEKRSFSGRKTYRHHAAEHMVANYYEKHGAVPSLSSLRECSMLNKSCGVNEAIIGPIAYLWFGLCFIFAPGLTMPVAMVAGIYVINKAVYLGGLRFCQYTRLLPPWDIDLEVAIEALKVWLQYEETALSGAEYTEIVMRSVP